MASTSAPTATTTTPTGRALTTGNPVRYFRAGGFNQIILRQASDLRHLPGLDPTLWVASSCPTRGLDLEPATLDFIDTDKDGRIRPPEILAAVSWILAVLKDTSTLHQGLDAIRLDQINTDHPDGDTLLRTIKRIHLNLGITDSPTVTLHQALDRSGIFAAVKSNGDGVIPVSAAETEPVARLIQNILDTVGGTQDLSGEKGVTAQNVRTFYQALNDWLHWWVRGHPADAHLLPPTGTETAQTDDTTAPVSQAGELGHAMLKEATLRQQVDPDNDTADDTQASTAPQLNPAIFVLGADTPAAFAALEAIRLQVEDFFRLVQLATFDPKAISHINFNENDLSSLTGRSRDEVNAMLAKIPLARVVGGATLPLRTGVNPAYASALDTLRTTTIAPILGSDIEELTREQWQHLLDTLQPYSQWLSQKAGALVEPLGIERISRLLHLSDRRQALEALINVDAALAAEIAAVGQVEKLLRLHRDLFRLLNNYVSLPQFYSPSQRAIFQMGTLLIDGCALNLCMEVEDIAQHMAIASSSGVFLVYCTTRRVGEERQPTICAAVTNRNAGRIRPGKNAVFYDRYGKDWDARVVQVVTNPVSLSEAVWAPFRKFGELISSQMERFTSSRQADLEKSITSTVSNLDQQVAQGTRPDNTPAPAQAAPSTAALGGMLAGGGVAIAAISSSVAYLAQTLSKINDIYLLYTVAIILTFIIAPSLILGFIKLRARDIGMILEASGWAINGRMRIELGIARELTHTGHLPGGSLRMPHPGITQRPRRLFWIILTLATLLALTSWAILRWY